MGEADFITAFGQLLRNGHLRDALANDPMSIAAQLCSRKADQELLVQLQPGDLEHQACVLLRKRLELIRPLIPLTIRNLNNREWHCFYDYSRIHWPVATNSITQDALGFLRHLAGTHASSVSGSEVNFLNFALSAQKFSMHWTQHPKGNRCIQILFRNSKGRVQQMIFYLKL